MDLRTRHIGIAFATVIVGLAAMRCDVGRQARFDPAHDSITVRAYFKGFGMKASIIQYDPEWRSDSATIRGISGQTVAARSYGNAFWFKIAKVLSADSAWVVSPIELCSVEQRWKTSGVYRTQAVQETLLVTRDVSWWVTNTRKTDGGEAVGLRIVPVWPEPRPPQEATHAVTGRVLDAASGLPAREKNMWPSGIAIHLAWDSAGTHTDSLGYFRLDGMRAGWHRLNVLGLDYSNVSVLVRVPGDTVTVRLIPGQPDVFMGDIPAASIPPWRVEARRQRPSLVGRWRGHSHSVEPSGASRPADEEGVFRFTLRSPARGGGASETTVVDWVREGDAAATRRQPLTYRQDSDVTWASRTPTEPGGLGWEFSVVGDTLVGQLIDPHTRTVSREFWATRVPN